MSKFQILASTLGCVAAIVLFYYWRTRQPWHGLPYDAPLIGNAGVKSDPNDAHPTSTVYVPVCNRGPATVHANVAVKGRPSEIVNPITEFSAPPGTYGGIRICEVMKSRRQSISLQITWHRGEESGVENFVIRPEQESN